MTLHTPYVSAGLHAGASAPVWRPLVEPLKQAGATATQVTRHRNLIKVDFGQRRADNPPAMHKVIHSDMLRQALQSRGWTQKDLAAELGVTAQSVTNWIKGSDFPRPDKLLKLAAVLRLNFSDLVLDPSKEVPVIAFRKKAGTKTTDAHLLKAQAMGELLKPLLPFLAERRALRLQVPAPSTQYQALQTVAAEIRRRLGLGDEDVLSYEHLIGEFAANGAVLVPVLWGEKQNHKNALHILLPKEQVTFIFVNLDTHVEDFKFWMAHELGHVYTPQLAGSNEGEDFADALAGALLSPQPLAQTAYAEAIEQKTANAELKALQRHAESHRISLFSVFCEVKRYAEAQGLPALRSKESAIHAARIGGRSQLVSELLFRPSPPGPATYLAAAERMFRSDFFIALRRMVQTSGTGPGYVQQIMDIPLQDAVALHQELGH